MYWWFTVNERQNFHELSVVLHSCAIFATVQQSVFSFKEHYRKYTSIDVCTVLHCSLSRVVIDCNLYVYVIFYCYTPLFLLLLINTVKWSERTLDSILVVV